MKENKTQSENVFDRLLTDSTKVRKIRGHHAITPLYGLETIRPSSQMNVLTIQRPSSQQALRHSMVVNESLFIIREKNNSLYNIPRIPADLPVMPSRKFKPKYKNPPRKDVKIHTRFDETPTRAEIDSIKLMSKRIKEEDIRAHTPVLPEGGVFPIQELLPPLPPL